MSRKSVLVGWLVLALVCCCLLVTQICLVDFFIYIFNVPDPYVGLDPAFTRFICLDLDLTFTSSICQDLVWWTTYRQRHEEGQQDTDNLQTGMWPGQQDTDNLQTGMWPGQQDTNNLQTGIWPGQQDTDNLQTGMWPGQQDTDNLQTGMWPGQQDTDNLQTGMWPGQQDTDNLETGMWPGQQDTAKHACSLRMWLCVKWHSAWLYGVHRTRRNGNRFMRHQPCQRLSTPLRWIFKTAL